MMSPKSIARWQELKAKKLSGRTVPEDMEYKKLQMKHDADVLALNELKWKAELAEALMTEAINNDELKQPDPAEKLADHLIANGVVPVVRCCDCKYRQENPDIDNTCYLTCNKIYGIQGTIAPDDYCSYGEREDEGK